MQNNADGLLHSGQHFVSLPFSLIVLQIKIKLSYNEKSPYFCEASPSLKRSIVATRQKALWCYISLNINIYTPTNQVLNLLLELQVILSISGRIKFTLAEVSPNKNFILYIHNVPFTFK